MKWSASKFIASEHYDRSRKSQFGSKRLALPTSVLGIGRRCFIRCQRSRRMLPDEL